jgi:hypothetical protein
MAGNSSHTRGGQAHTVHTTEARGDANARGCVSPLGGAMQRYSGDQSKRQEASERPQMTGKIHGENGLP